MMLPLLLIAAVDQAPVAGWAIERGAERCTASQSFPSSNGVVGVTIETPVSTDFAGIIKFTFPRGENDDHWASSPDATALLMIRPSNLAGVVRYATGAPTVSMALEPEKMASLARDEEISLELPNRPAFRVNLRYTRQLQAALKSCRDGILRGWGADPEALLGSGSARKTASWFQPSDYPPDALRAGIGGRVLFLAGVDRAGKPFSCKIVSGSGSMSLDSRTCEIALLRGVYPAGGSAAPATRWGIGMVRWKLPD